MQSRIAANTIMSPHARAEIGPYLNYYNLERRHSSLGYLSRCQFESLKAAQISECHCPKIAKHLKPLPRRRQRPSRVDHCGTYVNRIASGTSVQSLTTAARAR